MRIFHTIFFDLENTLIGHWTDRKLVYQDKIKSIIEEYAREDIRYGIFSYALWCDENIEDFKKNIKPTIEKEYGIRIDDSLVLHTQQMASACSRMTPHGKEIHMSEVPSYYNKNHAFKDYWYCNRKELKNTILVDDTGIDELAVIDQRSFKVIKV